WLDERRLRDVAADPEASPESSEARYLEPFGIRERLLGALGRLDPLQREVVLLHDLEGWTHSEIALAVGTSELMSRQHLLLARRKLRAFLESSTIDEAKQG